MRQRERIDCVRLDRKAELRPMPLAFEYKPANGWAWLQRLAIRILAWRKCWACTEFVTYERHVIGENGERFMQQLFQQRKNLDINFDRRPRRLLIGAEDYGRLMSEDPSITGFDFRAHYNMSNGPGQRPTICDLEIEVVPWMRGMLVMP